MFGAAQPMLRLAVVVRAGSQPCDAQFRRLDNFQAGGENLVANRLGQGWPVCEDFGQIGDGPRPSGPRRHGVAIAAGPSRFSGQKLLIFLLEFP